MLSATSALRTLVQYGEEDDQDPVGQSGGAPRADTGDADRAPSQGERMRGDVEGSGTRMAVARSASPSSSSESDHTAVESIGGDIDKSIGGDGKHSGECEQ